MDLLTQTWIYTGTLQQVSIQVIFLVLSVLPDGNTLICNGEHRKILRSHSRQEQRYGNINPYPMRVATRCLKSSIYHQKKNHQNLTIPDLDCSGSLSWTDIKPGATVTGSFQVQNIGNSSSLLNWTINTSSITWGTWTYTPESGENLSPGDGQVTVQVSVIAPDEKNSEFEGYIRVENKDNPNDFECDSYYS